jgi:hypothetical protein
MLPTIRHRTSTWMHPSAPGAASVRVWEAMSRGRGPADGRPPPGDRRRRSCILTSLLGLTIPQSIMARADGVIQ